MEARTWSVGELAAETGLTVRALHHYDEVGVLRPSSRTAAGHRRYTAGDVARLHRVTALRGFGFTLAEVAGLLDGGEPDDVRELVRRQLDQAEDRLDRARRLRDGLVRVLALLDAAAEPSAADLVRLMEAMTAVDHAYTPAELEQMAERRRQWLATLAPEEAARMQAERAAHLARLTPAQIAEMQARRASMRPD